MEAYKSYYSRPEALDEVELLYLARYAHHFKKSQHLKDNYHMYSTNAAMRILKEGLSFNLDKVFNLQMRYQFFDDPNPIGTASTP